MDPNVDVPRQARLFALDCLSPVEASPHIDFFRDYPRFGYTNALQFEREYLTGVGVVAAPWIATGVVLALVCVGLIIASATCLHANMRRAARFWREATGPSRVAVILLTAVVVLTAFGLGSTALVVTQALRVTAVQGITVLDATAALVDSVVRFVIRALTIATEQIDLGAGLVPPAQQESYQRLIAELRSRLDALTAAVGIISSYVQDAQDILQNIDGISRYVFIGLVIVLAILLLEPIIFNMATHHRPVTHLCLLFVSVVPLLISWILLGAVTSAAVITADSCVALQEFQMYVIDSGQEGLRAAPLQSNTTGNPLIDSNLRCPKDFYPDEIRLISDTVGILAGFVDVASFALNLTQNDVQSLANAGADLIDNITACSYTTSVTGRLTYYACGDYPGSVMSLVYVLWVVLLVFSLLCVGMFALSFSGVAVGAFTVVWQNVIEMGSEAEYTDFEPEGEEGAGFGLPGEEGAHGNYKSE